jgi:hypothetical protein
MFAGDPTGRKDQAGRPVGFYASVRGGPMTRDHGSSALKSHVSKGLKDNASHVKDH